MKKLNILAILTAIAVLIGCLTACGTASPAQNPEAEESNSMQIVTTIFPEYDWVREIVGDNKNAEINLLLDNGVDLHSYQPTADDLVKIADCDLFIYVGGESDEWVEQALQSSSNSNRKAINLLEALGDAVKEEEVVEGMEAEEDEEGEEGEEEETEYDEHVWLSLRNAETLCGVIQDALCDLDPDHAADYQNNCKAYVEKLQAMDQQYTDAVKSAKQTTLLFGDRFPFRYMTDDYGLTYYAAFVGCSAETEASFETVRFLAEKVDELNLTKILTIEGSDHKLAETIRDNSKTKNQEILSLDSMQSVTAKDVENGTTYLSVMEQNLSVLTAALQ